MKSASNAFKRKMNGGNPLLCYADLTLVNGVKLSFGPENDFMVDGNSVSDGSGSSGFPLGAAVAKTVTINIDNSDDRYSDYDFYMARVTVWTGIDLDDGTTERIREGTFTVVDAVTPGETLEINAINDMYKADITYVSSVTLPTDLITILKDVCSQCEMLLGSPSFRNQDYRVSELPTGTTCRAVIGYIAQIAGGNAYCDANNRLIIKTYDLSVFETAGIIDGGLHEEIEEGLDIGQGSAGVNPNQVDGGNFGDGAVDQADGGDFGQNEAYHNLYDWTSLTVATDDVVITGITTTISTDDGDEAYLYGIDGYTLNIDNPLIKGNEKDAVNRIGAAVVGITVRPFEGECVAYAIADFMDPVVIWDKKGNMYQTFLTDVAFEYVGGTTLKNSTEPPLRNQSNYYSNATEAYRKAREEADKLLKKQKAEWEKAMEDLSNRLENSSGLYTTIDKQEDGSSIFYMHDKPLLKESAIVWKQTAEAWGVSTDGGKTWNAGMTVDGDVITRILSTVGINADWIKAGLISDRKGKSFWNLNTGELQVNGKFAQYADNGRKSIDIEGNELKVYSWFDSGKHAGSVCSVKEGSDTTRLGLYCDFGGAISLGCRDGDNGPFVYIFDVIAPKDGEGAKAMSRYGLDLSGSTLSNIGGMTFRNGAQGKTGRAEFSDGSYLEFRCGILVGGNTVEGGTI